MLGGSIKSLPTDSRDSAPAFRQDAHGLARRLRKRPLKAVRDEKTKKGMAKKREEIRPSEARSLVPARFGALRGAPQEARRNKMKRQRDGPVRCAARVRRAVALSIRQPWAWLILNAGKDIENRNWPTNFRGHVLIHAAKGMTLAEYEDAEETLELIRLPIKLPMKHELERGGVVGEMDIVDCVTQSDSDWFFGTYGFVLRNAKPLPFRPFKGALGFFEASTRPKLSDPAK